MVQKLPSLFSPEVVMKLDDATVARIAAEDKASAAERARLTDDLSTLETGLYDLRLKSGSRVDVYGDVAHIDDSELHEITYVKNDGSAILPREDAGLSSSPIDTPTPPPLDKPYADGPEEEDPKAIEDPLAAEAVPAEARAAEALEAEARAAEELYPVSKKKDKKKKKKSELALACILIIHRTLLSTSLF